MRYEKNRKIQINQNDHYRMKKNNYKFKNKN